MRNELLLFALLVFSACGRPAVAPGPQADLPAMFARGFRFDATGEPHEAIQQYLAVVQAAAHSDRDPWQIASLQASLDALATRDMSSLESASQDAALVNRTREGSGIARTLARMAEESGGGPFAKGAIARTLTSMAQRRGDAAEAENWRTLDGCAREALVIGPTTWAPVMGVEAEGPLDRPDAPIEASYPAGGAFGTAAHPVLVRGRGCTLNLSAESWRPGVREVVIDVNVPVPQTIGVVLRAHGAAKLRVGGLVALQRPFELGDGEAARFARVSVTAGILRVTARVGTAKEEDSVEIDVWGQDGAPLRSQAPAIGSTSAGRAIAVQPVATPALQRDDDLLLTSAAALASGDARRAERLLWPAAARAGARPELALVYGRAVETARDLSSATRTERARNAYERVLEAWPQSWEAAIAHAVLSGVRRGHDEAGVEILRDLDATRAKAAGAAPSLLDVFDALTSGHERLFDRGDAALERARPSLAGTAIFSDAEDALSPRVGSDLVARNCDPMRPSPRDTLGCLDALLASGDHTGATKELARLRLVLGAPGRFLPLELREASGGGDTTTMNRVYAAMFPAERSLAVLSLLDRSPDARATLLRAAVSARDAPGSIAPILRAAGDDPTREFDGAAERATAQDRKSPILPNAATAILAHVERYDVDMSGLVRWILFDVRRVSGTTDVEENAQAATPEVWGRGAMRALRRRIFKRDGRILEPERTPRASQAHADLSQLEQGDIIEAIYEGWLLPGDTGDIGIDAPDLLPERTAVHDATVELRLPRALRGSLWSHPLLGKATERTDGSARLLSWHVVDQPVRRTEDGVPKMDRSVGVSFSTAQWQDIARALREVTGTLDEHDPEITAWAREAGAGATTTRATVDAVVAAVGKALREADAGTLSDYGGGLAPIQARTARTFLTSHNGSRSWLVLRSLRELAIPCDLVVAENEPFSADPAFPPHFGRFSHPLVVAHVEGKDVWIDADVQGPPLPAGRISPELRGRLALRMDGTVAPLPALGKDDERDEVDVRLVLDAQGNARGTFAVVLRGRDAQDLSEAFLRIVGAERQRVLRDVVLAWLPWANVDDVRLASSEGSWQISLRADVSVSGYAQLEAGKTWLLPGLDTLHWSWPHAHVASLGATFATRAGRESALALSSAVQYHVHRRIELPKGATVARLPGPVDIRAKLVEASRTIGVAGDGHLIEDDFALGVATGTIPAKDYDAFVSVAHAADDGFLASTRVAMP